MQASSTRPAATTASFDHDAHRIAVVLEKRKYLVLLILTVIYGIGAMLHARSKPLWYDEVITLVSAEAPTAGDTWRVAMRSDANPPLIHLLTHFAVRWFGDGEIAVRLPAIVGFWVFCLCLFRFTLRRVGIYYALVALLLPAATQAYNYAYEARAYGPELAFCGMALLAWQAAIEGPRKLLACLALGASLAGALFCHYYAILLYLPLAGAEAYRSWHVRRIDWGIWAGFVLGGIPLAWRAATVLTVVHSFSQTTWSPAYPEQAVEFWESGLQHSLSFLVLLLAMVAVWLLRSQPGPSSLPVRPPAPPAHEIVAGTLFLAIPVADVAAGLLVTHMFTPRYALIGLTGVVLLAPMVAAWLSAGRALPGFLLAWVAFLPLAFVTLEIPPPRQPFADETILAGALEHGPVVVADGQLFLQMWHYAPERLKSRLLFLTDDDAAVKYMGFDAIDSGVRVLRPWCSIQTMEYRDFAAPGKQFLVYQNPLRPGWLLTRIVADGGTAEVRAYANYRQLFSVRLKGPAAAAAPTGAN